jgi:radical SAM superfamily enzyme YgiQ (UPF0313 family)
MGYLAAMLHAHSHTAELVDVRMGPEAIVELVRAAEPRVVGFSLIFQFYLPQFREIAEALREAGVTAHFTIGGHYASLCPRDVLVDMPQVDSVARFEGEQTLLELVEALATGRDWRSVPGLAYLDHARPPQLVESAPRPLVADLDMLPWPYRPGTPPRLLGFPSLALLASRGCARRCSFCSIHTFYRAAPGKAVRVRRPEQVVAEMCALHADHGARIFLFQDDDFPLWGRSGAKWVEAFRAELHRTGLSQRVLWKISCRAEYVEPALFGSLRDAGLFMVYMGIESGVDSGLAVLNKAMTPQQGAAAVRVLKDLGLMYSYGFMLFDPSSTFDAVRDNIHFLRGLVGDGSAAALFCRMLPYAGTPIRELLAAEGRLHGDVTHPDYDFADARLNDFHTLLDPVAGLWVHNDGISHQLNWAWYELGVLERLVADMQGADEYRASLRALTGASNAALFRLVVDAADACQAGDWGALDGLLDIAAARQTVSATFADMLHRRDDFVAANLEPILAATDPALATAPAVQPA